MIASVGKIAPCLVLACACGDNAHTAGLDETIDVGDRIAIVHVPANVGAVPLVIALHGSGGVAARFPPLDMLADTEGFVTAYAQAAIPFGGGFEWHLPGEPLNQGPEPADAPDDVAYLEAVIREIANRYGIDRHRVYVTGFSGGARMASQAGCDLADVAAVAPIAGVRFPGNCVRDTQSVIAFHGTADNQNPYEGAGKPFWTYGVREAITGWAGNDHCGDPELTRPAATVELATFPGCRGGAEIELYTLEGEGHELPRAIDANATMWAAFQRHVLP